MRCRDVRIALSDPTTGIPPAILNHLETCESCRLEAESLGTTLRRISESPVSGPPDAYWGSILPRISEKTDGRTRFTSVNVPLRFALPVFAALALAILSASFLRHELGYGNDDIQRIIAGMPGDQIRELSDEQQSIPEFGSPVGEQDSVILADDDSDILPEIVRHDQGDPDFFTTASFMPETELQEMTDRESDEVAIILQSKFSESPSSE